MLNYALALTIPTSAVALLYARWEYRTRGRLSLLGLFLLSAMLFMPNLALEYATAYELPSTYLDYIGILVALFGIIVCLISIIHFRSISKVLCIDTGKLTLSGPYCFSRNPQYIGWFLFLLGFAMNDWSLWCLSALVVVAISLHLLILLEEEHLQRVFGEPYLDFCSRVPRYIAWALVRN